MYKKEVVGMLLAGGQGSRLGVLTKNIAKPAVSYAGKYRIIDFTLSNCINSGIDTVGVLTQYQPLKLNQHIGIGIPWDLDRKVGGVTVLSPHVKGTTGDWYNGTADAIYHNINYIEEYDPDYVIILSGDHIYKMDYSEMIELHKERNADITIAVKEVPWEEAPRYGIMNTNENDTIVEFEEKPENPKSNLASMGIYVFSWPVLKKALLEGHEKHENNDFGKHIIPESLEEGLNLVAYRFKGYWKDVGTVDSYWKANMEMIDVIPEFNLFDDYWKIYTNSGEQMPCYFGENGTSSTSIISGGSEINGTVENSVIGYNVMIEEGAEIKDSIVMSNSVIKKNAKLNKAIVCENSVVSENTIIGVGEDVINEEFPKIYFSGISVVGEKAVVPSDLTIGMNCVITGEPCKEDFTDGKLPSGKSIHGKEVEK